MVRALRDYGKLRLAEDEPDAPAYVRDRTPLRRGQMTTAALRDEFRRNPALPMLVGDDVFVKGIRKGVEAGEYVYRRDALLYGPGDATATIHIDEQAAVFTMSYAREQGLWPRPQKATPHDPGTAPGVGGSTPAGVGQAQRQTGTSEQDETMPATITNGVDAPGRPPPATMPVLPLQAEGVLREALVRLWEQARSRKVERLASLAIRVFDAADGFRLLGVVAAVRAADGKRVSITSSYETASDSRLDVNYTGTPQDAAPLKDFLDPQLRAAREKTLEVRFDLSFAAGLPMAGDAAQMLTEQLTRFATGAAFVEATATVAQPIREAAE